MFILSPRPMLMPRIPPVFMPVFPGSHLVPFPINIHRWQLPPNMFVLHNGHVHKSFTQIDNRLYKISQGFKAENLESTLIDKYREDYFNFSFNNKIGIGN